MSPCILSLYEEKQIKSVKETCKGGKGRGVSLYLSAVQKPSLSVTLYCCTKHKEHLMREDMSIGYVLVYLVLYFICCFFLVSSTTSSKKKGKEKRWFESVEVLTERLWSSSSFGFLFLLPQLHVGLYALPRTWTTKSCFCYLFVFGRERRQGNRRWKGENKYAPF